MLAAAGGCGASEPGDASSGTTVAPISADEQALLDEIAANRASDPRTSIEDANQPDDDRFAFGQELVLGDRGPRPATLVAIVDEELVLRNERATPVVVRFTNGTVGAQELTETPPIEPGGTFAITPTRAVSIRYQYADAPEITGSIQVDTGQFQG